MKCNVIYSDESVKDLFKKIIRVLNIRYTFLLIKKKVENSVLRNVRK